MTNQPSRWHVSTESGRRWNERKATHPCSIDGCDRSRYESPAGWVNTRCREHEAELRRTRWAGQHPDYRPYRRRTVGLEALCQAANAGP